jgi:Zn-dependent metalloprotease
MHYNDYQANLSHDNGGVRFNSGIASYACYTAAMGAGGPSLRHGRCESWDRLHVCKICCFYYDLREARL